MTTAIWTKLLVSGVERSIWMPTASEELFTQLKVTADALVEQATHANKSIDARAANPPVGFHALGLFVPQSLVLKCAHFSGSHLPSNSSCPVSDFRTH